MTTNGFCRTGIKLPLMWNFLLLIDMAYVDRRQLDGFQIEHNVFYGDLATDVFFILV